MQLLEKGDGTEPVSYTHLDVYKRQAEGFDDRQVTAEEAGKIQKICGMVNAVNFKTELDGDLYALYLACRGRPDSEIEAEVKEAYRKMLMKVAE